MYLITKFWFGRVVESPACSKTFKEAERLVYIDFYQIDSATCDEELPSYTVRNVEKKVVVCFDGTTGMLRRGKWTKYLG